MKMDRKRMFWFWSGMDLFYLLQFIGWNIYHQRIPLYDDMLSYLQLLHTYGSAAAWLFPLHFLLIISIPVSMVLLWKQSRYGVWLVYAQTPLRLVFMQPSLSLVLWMVQAMAFKGAALYIGLLLVSELAKVVTLWRYRKV